MLKTLGAQVKEFKKASIATPIFMIIRNEARANSAKPLRLLLRVPLAFLPFG